jgi:hypothetical protein
MDECIDINESPASFPGGIKVFQNWFAEEILKIESVTQLKMIKGIAHFVINTDGSVSDVQIVEINHLEVSNDMVQILEKSPKWNACEMLVSDYPPKYYRQRVALPFEIKIK